jgi:hypothetical protein
MGRTWSEKRHLKQPEALWLAEFGQLKQLSVFIPSHHLVVARGKGYLKPLSVTL